MPLPAGPVKNTEFPLMIDSTIEHCSLFRVDLKSGGNSIVIGGGFVIAICREDARAGGSELLFEGLVVVPELVTLL